jgi:hypothetical protein
MIGHGFERRSVDRGANGFCDRGHHLVGVTDTGETDKENTVGVVGRDLGGDCHCQTGLADSAGPAEGDETDFGPGEQRPDLSDLGTPTNEGGQLGREVDFGCLPGPRGRKLLGKARCLQLEKVLGSREPFEGECSEVAQVPLLARNYVSEKA